MRFKFFFFFGEPRLETSARARGLSLLGLMDSLVIFSSKLTKKDKRITKKYPFFFNRRSFFK